MRSSLTAFDASAMSEGNKGDGRGDEFGEGGEEVTARRGDPWSRSQRSISFDTIRHG